LPSVYTQFFNVYPFIALLSFLFSQTLTQGQVKKPALDGNAAKKKEEKVQQS
jgi:hypothetical protein